ncbi:MAG: hypothetical protein WBQ60_10705 [Asticcacaulis sp.]
MFKYVSVAGATLSGALLLAACTPASKPSEASVSSSTVAEAPVSATSPSVTDLPAGEYVTDKAHTSLTFNVSHMGFSHYD